MEVCKIVGRDKPRVLRIHKAGLETVQRLLLLRSAVDKERVEQTVGHLSERSQREILLARYGDRLDYRRARLKFGVNRKEPVSPSGSS
jgi:hypothetical protein